MLYHISNKSNLKILNPFIPSCALVGHEDRKTPRICFSSRIEGCLSAIDCASKFYVYTPIDGIEVHKPTVDECRDAKYTDEVWALESVPVRCLGRIEATYLDKFDRHNSGRGRVLVYQYTYKWLNQI